MSDDPIIYSVVINHEEQYSIWPADRENPLGWKNVGKSGTKEECLAYIDEVWTDMRPLSLRRQMEEEARLRETQPDPGPAPDDEEWNRGPSLVERLSQGAHRVEASLRPEKTVQLLKECIDRGYVHIRFPDTRGGTELGVRLDRDACDFSKAQFEHAAGKIRLVGGLTLDYVQVRCIADLDLATLSGEGRLETVGA